jgi:hypothetical protein
LEPDLEFGSEACVLAREKDARMFSLYWFGLTLEG